MALFGAYSSQAECTATAGESGHDFGTHEDYIEAPTVTDQLLILVACNGESSLAGVKIYLSVAGKQCGPFEWDFVPGLGYYGTFPRGLQGSIGYTVTSSDDEPVASGNVPIMTAKAKQSGCPNGARKCRKKIDKLKARARKSVCNEAVNALRGAIILNPK